VGVYRDTTPNSLCLFPPCRLPPGDDSSRIVSFLSASLTDIDNKGALEAWISWLTVTSAQCRKVLSLLAVSTIAFYHAPTTPCLNIRAWKFACGWVRSHVGDCRITLPGCLAHYSSTLVNAKIERSWRCVFSCFSPSFIDTSAHRG
jgi:hypothetical protein